MKFNYSFVVDGRGDLRMFVTYQRKKFSYSLGFSVDKAKWDNVSQRVKRNTTHGKKLIPAAKINAAIQHAEDVLQTISAAYTSSPTADDFKNDIGKALGRKTTKLNDQSFFDLYTTYINSEKVESGWSKGTVYKQQRLLKEWKEFCPTMAIDNINEDLLNQFRDFQISLGHQNETVKKKLSMSKWFFRWLLAKGIIKDACFTAYKVKLKKASKVVVFLTWDELMNLYNHNFEDGYLSRVRDVFCFCCFTGLRYSDAYKLQKKDIYDAAIHIVTAKTNDKLTIELNNYSSSILSKYANLEGDRALPVISNQKMNVYIKEACKICGINEKLTNIYYRGNVKYEETKEKWELIGSHAGRRTFVCNALMLGISPNIVMKWTGHSDYKSMKPYIDIADTVKKSAMQMFNR